jgi:hypothetical protein
MNAHVERSELSEWILGIGSDQVARHLQTCGACRAEANALQNTIGSFKECVHLEADRDALFWSRQRALIRARVTARRPAFLLRRTSVAAMVLLLGAVLLLTQAPQVSQSANNDVADDALLQQVDNDVRQDFPTALGPAVLISQERNSALLTNAQGNFNYQSTNQDKER